MSEEELLRKILDTQPNESTLDAARRLVDELQEWRDGCAAAFGIMTASPHRTLVTLAQAEHAHHREHHERERAAWQALHAIAIAYNLHASERAAKEALDLLDEQGTP